MMKVQILSREYIKPSTPTDVSSRNYKLSLLDEVCPHVNVPLIFYYQANVQCPNKNNTSSESICNSLKKSLSMALTGFYLFAGRYMKEGHLVDCSDQGAEFVEAKVDGLLNDLLCRRTTLKAELLDNLLPIPIRAAGEITDPLLAVQVSIFSCGGFAIGVCSSHKISDMSTISTFINLWAVAAKHEFSGTTDEGFLPITPNVKLNMLFPGKGMQGPSLGLSRNKENIKVHKIVTKMFSFNKSGISILQEKARQDNSSKRLPTRVQSVFGLIGKAIIDINVAKPGNPRDFIFVQSLNMRGRTIPPLPKNLLGNLALMFTTQYKAAERGEELDVLVNLLSDSVKRAVEIWKKIPLNGEEAQLQISHGFNELKSLSNTDTIKVIFSSWCKFSFYEADFGLGKPIWVSLAHIPTNNSVVLFDDKDGEGIEAWVSLDENDMTKFEEDCNIREHTS